MVCQSCGGEMKDGILFCPHCGMRVCGATEAVSGGPGGARAVSENRKSRKGLWILLAVGFNLLVIAAVVIVLWKSPYFRYRREMGQALGWYEDGKYEKAAKAYSRALDLREDSEDALDGLTASYLSAAKECYDRGDYEETITYCRMVYDMDPENEDAKKGFCNSYLAMAKERYEDGDYEEALNDYEKVLKKDENNKDAKNGKIVCCMTLARAYKASADKYKAYQYYTKVLEEDPENQQALEEREQCGKLHVDGDMASWEEAPDP